MAPGATELGVKAAAIVAGASTWSDAVVPRPVIAWVEDAPLVATVYAPAAAPVTIALNWHEAPAAMDATASPTVTSRATAWITSMEGAANWAEMVAGEFPTP